MDRNRLGVIALPKVFDPQAHHHGPESGDRFVKTALAVEADAGFLDQRGERDIVEVAVDVEIAEACLEAGAERIARRVELGGIGLWH